ncbi:hypothetical protein LXL04_033948 [Taraxacum kok-saghyz]
MAMRARGGRTNPTRPPRLIVGRVYEQFKPMYERRQGDDHDTLFVYLPGFQKEYIKVTTEDVNTVRVRGERLVTENKWSRFQEDFRVPEECDMGGIRARFDGGILTITMPRKITANNPTTSTAPRVAPKAEEQPFRRTNQEEELSKPKNESKPKETSPESEKKPNKPPSPSKSRMVPPPPTLPSLSKPSKQEPLKFPLEAKEKNEEFIFGSLPTSVTKKEKDDVVEKTNEEREIHEKGVSRKTDLHQGKGKEKSVEGEKKRVSEGRMGKSKDAVISHGGFLGDKVEEVKKVVASREVNEDRKLLVNMGVGVLVIVALGVHVSYAIGLIWREK